MYKCLFLFAFFLSNIQAYGTVFSPISIKQQIKESDGVLEGEVTAIESVEQNNVIHSKVTVLANRWIGLTPEDNFIDIYFPGGKVGDKVFKIDGAPKFKIGEGVVLFTKIHKGKNWVNNLGLGKYTTKQVGERTLIVNQIFPAHPTVGQMKLEKFYELSEWVKKEKFKERFKDKYEVNYENEMRLKHKLHKRKRSIASIGSVDSPERSQLSSMWLVLLLGGLGAIFGVLRRRT